MDLKATGIKDSGIYCLDIYAVEQMVHWKIDIKPMIWWEQEVWKLANHRRLNY